MDIAGSLCNLARQLGVGCHVAASSRFWYNASSMSCQLFIYNGCQGNQNNFPSLESCLSVCNGVEAEVHCPRGDGLREDGRTKRCAFSRLENECPPEYECFFDGSTYGCCPTSESICVLSSDAGELCDQKRTQRWHFNKSSNACRPFLFLGCGGNANSFPTRQACREYCSRPELGCPSGGDYHRHPSGELVECSSALDCPSNYECSEPILPQGREVRLCCPSRQHVCRQSSEYGVCAVAIKRFSFDGVTQQCRALAYAGCQGNLNNFPSAEICLGFCLSAACPTAESVYISPLTGSALDCSLSPCPVGYSCVPDVWNSTKMVCCGTTSRDVCPDRFLPFVNQRTLLPMTCRSNRQDACPRGYHCLLHMERRRYFCCGEIISKSSCPFGARLIRLRTGDPSACIFDAHCPEGAECHRPDHARSGMCCRSVYNGRRERFEAEPPLRRSESQVSNADCPPGYALTQRSLRNEQCLRRMPSSCSTKGSVCAFSRSQQKFACCRKKPLQMGGAEDCPSEGMKHRETVLCSPEKSCPPAQQCVRRRYQRNGFCCAMPYEQTGFYPDVMDSNY